jgi:E3 ubiquitin-protein ligase makorin
MCRSHSYYIIPSTFFPTLENAKTGVVERYLSRLKTIPCRYFEQSIKDSAAPEYKFKCQFGNSCHYSHKNPTTEEPYTFSQEELDRMKRKTRRPGRARMLEDMAIMEMLFADLSTGYNGNEEPGSEIQDDDMFAEILYEPEFPEISFDEFGVFDVFDVFDDLW